MISKCLLHWIEKNIFPHTWFVVWTGVNWKPRPWGLTPGGTFVGDNVAGLVLSGL